MSTIICPTPRQIAELVRGESPTPFAEQISEHINSCSSCSRSLVHIESLEHPAVVESYDPDWQTSGKTVRAAMAPADNPLAFLSPPTSPDELGRLAHYRVFRVLGEGGMGIVLHGEDTQLNRPVALKVIKPEFNQDTEMLQRFDREARAMAQIKSEHVVTVYQVGRDNDTCFIAMELLEGESLDDLIDRKSKVSIAETTRIGCEIAQALSSAHSAGLIHRDIKPANVWLSKGTGRVKLLDFGLARPQSIDLKLTNTGLILGTPAYMAPEQARGMSLDSRTDLFSLGCLLYKMSCGLPPFYAETPLALMFAIVQESPRPPSYHNIELPAALDDLIMHLLEKESENRPQTAEAVVSRLRSIEMEITASNQTLPAQNQGNSIFQSKRITRNSILVGPLKDSAPDSSQSFVVREAEHRQVTVLVCGCELFEQEDYLDRFDSDERRDLLTLFYRSCEQALDELGGTVVQRSDGSVLACFGYPIAHEDAGARAAKAALTILQYLEPIDSNLQQVNNISLGTWIVINTGPATVERKDNRVSLVGEARNVATRLEAVVSTGQIVCTEATHRLLSGKFASTSLGEHKVKNLSQKVALFQIHSMVTAASMARPFDSQELTPLAGRGQELSLLKGRWEQAREGSGQVVQLIGEAGLGKSRLVHELMLHVSDSQTSRAAVIINWYGSPHFQNTSFYPIRTFFQRLLNFDEEMTASARSCHLIEHLEKLDLALPNTVPLFISLLGLPLDIRFPSLGLSPVREREETFRALKEWLYAYTSDKQLLLVVEDLQWFDSTSLEFLSQVLAESASDPVLSVLTSRPGFAAPWAPLTHQTNLPLPYLTKSQVSELLRKKTGLDLQPSVVNMIFDRAGGVPLFVEEFTQLAAESGLLKQSDAGVNFKTEMMRAIPATLQDLIMARLDHLEGDRDVAQFAATLGREFSYELIMAAAGNEEAALNLELTKLVQAEILLEKGRRPRSTFIFKNPLLQEALYNTLIMSRRQQFHAVIVETLEAKFPEIVKLQPELLAFHCLEAGQGEHSIAYWIEAGIRSKEIFANTEAIGHFNRGRELLATLPESSVRDSIEVSLLVHLGPAYQAVFGYAAPDVGPTTARARELLQKMGDVNRLFAVMWGNWTWTLVRAELEQCTQLAEEMRAIAAQSKDHGLLMEASVAEAVLLYYCGDFSGCLAVCKRAIEQFEDQEQCLVWSASTGQNASVVVRCYLSMALWYLGYREAALQVSDEMLLLARKIGHPFSLAHGLYFRGRLLFQCRLGEDLRWIAVEKLELARLQGFGLWLATGMFQEGTGMFLTGVEPEAALARMERGFAAFRALSACLTVPAQICSLGEAYLKYGQLDKANELLTEGLHLSQNNWDRTQEAELHRLFGKLALRKDDQTTAEASFRTAIEVARGQRCRPFELRAAINLALLLEKQGQRQDARSTLATICGELPEGMSMPELNNARELLERLK